MFTNRKIIYISFFALFIFLITVFFVVKRIKREKREYKSAIIVVPGIGGSELFYNGANNDIYSEGEAIFLRNELTFSNINQIIDDIKTMIKNLEFLECDENGLPKNKEVGLLQNINKAKMKDVNLHKYGFGCMHKNLINLLKFKFGKKTPYAQDIIFFNYDWRLSCNTNGDLLEKLIQKYDRVSLIAYSMGGLVSCKAICNLYNKSQIKKIDNYISICVPYNGSVRSLFSFLTGLLEENSIINFFYKNLECDKAVKRLLKNYASIYELLPTEEYFSRSKGYLKDEKGNFLNYLETTNYIKNKLNLNNILLDNAVLFHKNLFINQKHILEYLKKKFFIVGKGYDTLSQLSKKKEIEFIISKHDDGDATVELYNSAIPPVKNIKNLDFYKIKTLHSKILNNKYFLAQLIHLLEKNLKKK